MQSIETCITDTALAQLAGDIKGPAGEFANTVKTPEYKEDIDIANLSSIGYLRNLRHLLVNIWTPPVVNANAALYEMLKTCEITSSAAAETIDRTLTLQVSGITTQLLMFTRRSPSVRWTPRSSTGKRISTSTG